MHHCQDNSEFDLFVGRWCAAKFRQLLPEKRFDVYFTDWTKLFQFDLVGGDSEQVLARIIDNDES